MSKFWDKVNGFLDKHFEVIVRQMMRKVQIEDPGDTRFLEKQLVNKNASNNNLFFFIIFPPVYFIA